MKIYAFHLKLVQDNKLVSGVYFKVGTCMKTAEKELISEYTNNYRNKNIRIERSGEMELFELTEMLKPHLEKMIKTTSDKDKLLEVIKKLPID